MHPVASCIARLFVEFRAHEDRSVSRRLHLLRDRSVMENTRTPEEATAIDRLDEGDPERSGLVAGQSVIPRSSVF